MAKRKVGSQTGSLTLDHEMSGINPIFMCASGMQHTVGKLQRELELYFRPCPDRRSDHEVIASAKLRESQPL
jgi:hypothetical protein